MLIFGFLSRLIIFGREAIKFELPRCLTLHIRKKNTLHYLGLVTVTKKPFSLYYNHNAFDKMCLIGENYSQKTRWGLPQQKTLWIFTCYFMGSFFFINRKNTKSSIPILLFNCFIRRIISEALHSTLEWNAIPKELHCMKLRTDPKSQKRNTVSKPFCA